MAGLLAAAGVRGSAADKPVVTPTVTPVDFWGIAPHFYWSGSWETEKNTVNRVNLALDLPWWDLSLRGLFTDRRTADFDAGISALNGGIYHRPTASRVLYGIVDEWGLPARLKNPWIRAAPYVENHKPQSADLKTEPSSTKKPEAYLYLGTPQLGPLRFFASTLLENDLTPAFGGGIDWIIKPKTEMRLEGFYTGKTLPYREASAWFSETPPLPERDFRFYALGFLFNSPLWGLASDWAYSETFAYGQGLYGNVGLRFGDKPWQFSLAADASGDRYVGRDGSVVKEGFRIGARLDRKGVRNGLFRVAAVLRGPEFGEDFDRIASQIYYRFPAAPPRSKITLRFSRISLELNRNAQNLAKIEDSAGALVGLKYGIWGGVLDGKINHLSSAEDHVLPFPVPDDSTVFDSARLAGEITCNPGSFSFGAKVGYTASEKKDDLWDTSIRASVRAKNGRLSLKLASAKFPEDWSGTITWRLELP